MDKILSLLGLAARGRNLVSGEFSTEKAVKEGKAQLVIVSTDASDNTKKLFTDKCNYRDIPIYYYSEKEELGKAIGRSMYIGCGNRPRNGSKHSKAFGRSEIRRR